VHIFQNDVKILLPIAHYIKLLSVAISNFHSLKPLCKITYTWKVQRCWVSWRVQ